MQRRKAAGIVGSALAVALLVAGCAEGGDDEGGGGGGQAAGPFTVVVDTGFTGPTAAVANQVLLGVQTAADEVNAAGGINGRQVEIVKIDDGGDPTKAVTELQNYLSSGKTPDVVYAGINSSETLALLPLLSQRKIVSIAQTQSAPLNDPAKYPYHFGISPTNKDRGAVFGPQLVKDGVKKLAAVVPADAFGKDVAAMLTAVTQANGVSLDVQEYDISAVDYSSSYQRAIRGNPDAVFIEGTGDASAGLFAARLKVGATKIRTYGGFGVSSVPPNTIAEAASLPNCSFPVYSYTVQGALSGGSAEALAPLAAKVKEAKAASVFVPGLGYDAMRTIAKAAGSGANDAEALKQALSSLTIEPGYLVTQTGGFSYSATSHFPGSPKGADQRFVPCDAKTGDGFWQVSS